MEDVVNEIDITDFRWVYLSSIPFRIYCTLHSLRNYSPERFHIETQVLGYKL